MNDKNKTEEFLYIQLIDGLVKIKLFPEKAPNHIEQIKRLANSGFYDKLKFHRVIPKFMAQTGCPYGTGTGGSGNKLKAEFNDLSHQRGACSMARSVDLDSADSQFFICFKDSSHLDGNYTVWGKVIKGMNYIDMIKKGDPEDNGMVKDPDLIIKMWTEEE